jgi:hypothetical protein
MLKHLYLIKYKQAILKEFNSLINRGTFEYIKHINKKLMPLIWVYANKFDENGFFINFKAKLVTKGDLYKIKEETYAATLVA